MIIAVTGHRPPKLGGYWFPNSVHNAVVAGLLRKFRELQPSVVLTGMALGVDQWAAEICRGNGIPYDAIIPFHGFESRWPDASKRMFRSLCSTARQIHVVTDTSDYSPGLLQRRNQWLVDHCSTLVAVWNGSTGGTANCVNYARMRQKPVVTVDLPDAIWAEAREREMLLMERRQPVATQGNNPPFIRRRRTENDDLLVNILGRHEAMEARIAATHLGVGNVVEDEPKPIPSPFKGDKPPTHIKTGRVIDLDD